VQDYSGKGLIYCLPDEILSGLQMMGSAWPSGLAWTQRLAALLSEIPPFDARIAAGQITME
jgi:hypothetical protein